VSAAVVLWAASSAPSQGLFEADRGTGNIYAFTPGGAQSVFASGLGVPFGLAVDSDGNLYVGDARGGTVTRITPTGTRTPVVTLNGPAGMAFDSAGNLYVAQGGFSNGNVVKVTPSGAVSVFAAGLVDPWGLAFDGAGNLFVASVGSQSGAGFITKITPGGIESTFASGLDPNGLAFDAAGNLYVSSGYNSYIYKYTPTGDRSVFVSGASGLAGLSAFDSKGDLFVAGGGGQGTGYIYEFSPSGARSTFASGLSAPAGVVFMPVPEPSGVALLGLGLGTVLVCRHRRQVSVQD